MEEKIFALWDNVLSAVLSKIPSRCSGDVSGAKKHFWNFFTNKIFWVSGGKFYLDFESGNFSRFVKNPKNACGEKKGNIFSHRRLSQAFSEFQRKFLVGLSNLRSKFATKLLGRIKFFFSKKNYFLEKLLDFRAGPSELRLTCPGKRFDS